MFRPDEAPGLLRSYSRFLREGDCAPARLGLSFWYPLVAVAVEQGVNTPEEPEPDG